MSRPTQTLSDFSSVVSTPESAPLAVLIATGSEPLLRVVPLQGGRAVLGREIDRSGGQLDLADGRASRKHAEVRLHAGMWHVRDLGSHNGTFVDGRRADGEVVAPDGAIVRCGHSLFWLIADGAGYQDDCVTSSDGVVSGPRLRAVDDAARRAATAASLLILGESGSGKERIARLYHGSGGRGAGPFVAVNCAAIPEGVAERLLFGARRGAYSGAEDAPGYVQAAAGGTLFLDELGDLPLPLQAKLLRVLETREVWPVGASKGVPVELGVVAATHHDLRRAVADGRFREDLYYRLTKPAVAVPPLRERRDEIPMLAAQTIAAVEPGLRPHARLLELLCTRPWPGNVRELVGELRSAAEAAQAAGATEVRIEQLPAEAGQRLRGGSAATPTPTPATATPAPRGEAPSAPVASPRGRVAAEVSRDELTAALDGAAGNLSAAARALGLHRTQLYRLMDRHGLARPGGSSAAGAGAEPDADDSGDPDPA